MTVARLFWAGLVAACLASCAAAPPPELRGEALLLRTPTAPIGSQVDVVAADLAGDWVVRQGVLGQWPASAGRATFGASAQAPGGRLFLEGAVGAGQPVAYAPTQLGRWAAVAPEVADGAGLPREIWVYWMDFDRRTMAIGDPNGRFVAILDRQAQGGGDRVKAARDILEWYGYDLRRIEEVTP